MKIAVMGAGAVGCYFGGMLARAGHEVVLIGRPAHVEAVQRQGLRLQTRLFDETLSLAASTEPAAAAGAELLLFCVKSPDTEAAAQALRPHLAPGALLLSLQNGVDNAERLRELLPVQRVSAAVVYVATEMAGPGHLLHHGRGELVLEPVAEALLPTLALAGVPAEISPNVRGALWAKLILNCAYNALSALARLPYGELVQRPGVPAVMEDVVAECVAVARAEGVQLPADPLIAVRGLAQTMPGQFSSTAQDLMRGKPTEIDHLNGHVLRRGEALGIPTPANRVLHTLVKLAEARPG
ncbi:2-dehydropantoate 2-reductase [Kinneretia asaccharophila]|uniref:2-dehydropantoate 2-reductase n=1 Tax=Roseateles asaccharophilus TaxID=582607 RepID=A0A4R6MTB3_9BURK|nr:2-dehydropantoate 2-reductase [Roseateles asaccharophilus]MDN3546285.1 2-dehydropantoate 2-reductase [Roseateles asaccharophilus]TDP05613.1 ketopantoate reductase [Roseateles asaccharophilus]